jgi:PAS domain S-box-containing protein
MLFESLRSLPEAIVIVDRQAKILISNPPAQRLLGGYIAPRSMRDSVGIHAPRTALTGEWLCRNALRGEASDQTETWFETNHSTKAFAVAMNTRAVRDANGKIVGAIAILRDVTREKAIQTELRLSKQELEVKVAERTYELQEVNRRLESQLADVQRAKEERSALLQAEQVSRLAVEDAHARFQLVAKATNDGLWDWNLKTDQIWWGENIYTLFGFPPSVVGNHISWWYNNVHPDDRDRVVSGIHRVIAHGEKFWNDEYRYRRIDGTYANLLDRGYVAYDAEGKPARMIGAMMDISARKRTEEEVARLAAIVRYSNDAVLSLDLENIVLSWNERAEKMFGYTAKEIVGQSISVLNPGRAAESMELRDRVNRGDRVEDFESTRLRKDGKRIDVSMTISPIKDALGQTVGYSNIIRDITERKVIERQVEFQAQMLSLVNDVVVATDLHHRITYWNSAAERLFGIPAGIAIGLGRGDLISFEIGEGDDRDPFEEVLQRGGNWVGERVAFGNKGYKANVEVWVSSLYDDALQSVGLLIIMHDFTGRKEAEEKLKAQAQELVRSNEELVQFAYVASHDLKEPLRMVTNFLQLLARRYKGKLDQDADDYIQFAVGGALRMYELINDLLIYSRVGMRGEGNLKLTDCNQVFETVTNNLQVSIRESGAMIRAEPLPSLTVDPTQMVQLFQNLLSNAIKFRGRTAPEVNLRVDLVGREWVFSIQDNGIGIDPCFAERIFVIFQRLHSREDYPGTGIGLAICKKIVERHGGRIWVDSKPGYGSIFKFTLPAQRERARGMIKAVSTDIAKALPG